VNKNDDNDNVDDHDDGDENNDNGGKKLDAKLKRVTKAEFQQFMSFLFHEFYNSVTRCQ
jgi:hypothetical protein